MKRSIAFALIIASLGVGATFAATVSSKSTDYEQSNILMITRADVEQHAKSLFDKIDIDQSQNLSVDEFSSQAVIIPELSRFNRIVTIDGVQTVEVPLPDHVKGQINYDERTIIDTVARKKYYTISGLDGQLSKEEWVAYQLSIFTKNDYNNDGRLHKAELQNYALDQAKYQQVNS